MTSALLARESSRPLAIDLFCGLGGWTEGLLAEGYDVIGFDIERHVYGEHKYPAQLVLQDVLTLHGRQFRNADLIVASPPCQAYSYRAMPFKRAKALPPPDNTLFETCFRIQREACEAAGRHIPLVVENVRGAQKWVGRARWNYGSFYLWGDVPALMPMTAKRKVLKAPDGAHKNAGGSWFRVSNNNVPHSRGDGVKVCDCGHAENDHDVGVESPCCKCSCINPSYAPRRVRHTPHMTNPAEHGTKVGGIDFSGYGKPGYKAQAFNTTAQARLREEMGIKQEGSGEQWFDNGLCRHGSKSPSRKFASAMIAKIPLPLARHVAAVWKPREELAA